MKIRYGTRGSALALAQSDGVAQSLRRLHRGLEPERVVIHTSGDRFGTQPETGGKRAPVPIQAPPNVKAMFVKEIEEALLAGTIDFAVHSCKDLPAELPKGLCIAAYPLREDALDVFVGSVKHPSWQMIRPGDRIGTAALRRQIQLKLAKPGIDCVPIRGNVDTRLKRIVEHGLSGIVLAKAGLRRLGRDSVRHEILPVDVIVPAPGQGALAIEARADRRDVLTLLSGLDDPNTKLAVECERAFMAAMGGGCRSPLGAYASRNGGQLRLDVFWSDEAGRNSIRRNGFCDADIAKSIIFAQKMARECQRP